MVGWELSITYGKNEKKKNEVVRPPEIEINRKRDGNLGTITSEFSVGLVGIYSRELASGPGRTRPQGMARRSFGLMPNRSKGTSDSISGEETGQRK